jgi:hypothetical protein
VISVAQENIKEQDIISEKKQSSLSTWQISENNV